MAESQTRRFCLREFTRYCSVRGYSTLVSGNEPRSKSLVFAAQCRDQRCFDVLRAMTIGTCVFIKIFL